MTSLRGAAARIPVVGPAFKRAYLTWIKGEGKICPIRGGLLEGMRYYRYQWSTPREDLVQTNWDDEAACAFARLIKGKRRVFDIGANWGFYVLLAHKYREGGCEIVAFEPHPRSAKELRTQITLNGIDRVQVVEAAMSDRQGTVEFIDTGSAIGQRMSGLNQESADARKLIVPAITLDAAAERFGMPDLVKIDVEGAENMVLEGGQKVLTTQRPMLVVEIHGAERCGRFYELMRQYRYRCETAAGTAVNDGAYHHQLICFPE